MVPHSTHVASTDIAEILRMIQTNNGQVSDMVNNDLHVVESGRNSADDIARLFGFIRLHTHPVLEQVQDLKDMNEHIRQSSSIVLSEVNSVAAIEQVLVSADIQQQHVSETIVSIGHLNLLSTTLERLTKKS